ncbi:CRE-CUTL-10 protein [Aphelenchoides avenae]|nr:CRE-CUTL-10 protein [Aphelenchus avenae]
MRTSSDLRMFLTVHSVLLLFVCSRTDASILDNGVVGDPQVDCMEDRVRLTFHTARPFTGRIFVKGMIDNEKCVNNYVTNTKQQIDFSLNNGDCNMRRSRKMGPDQRGLEMSLVIVISFHETFITKVDRLTAAHASTWKPTRSSRIALTMLPTTELIDTAKMPLCTYTVRRGSVNGPIVTYATVGEPVFHVWHCDSDMFSMLTHSCWVDDGAGKDRKLIIDEHGCSVDPVIVADLTYNNQANLAYSEVNVFKFADKVTTYFQCAVSTCMISEGMCKGKTPPRCSGSNIARKRRTVGEQTPLQVMVFADKDANRSASATRSDDFTTMDLSADRITVLDLDDIAPSRVGERASTAKRDYDAARGNGPVRNGAELEERLHELRDYYLAERVCFSYHVITLLTCVVAFAIMMAVAVAGAFLWRNHRSMRKL